VEGYLVVAIGACTLRDCVTLERSPYPCNTCDFEVRLGASPKPYPSYDKGIRFTGARHDRFLCSSINGRITCGLDAKGQHVLVRASLEFPEMDYLQVSLKEPEICELPR
jgi:hypothetical protein